MLEEMMPEFAIALGNATRMDEHAAEETLAFDADAGPVLEGARAS
jgi:hypothetical protein